MDPALGLEQAVGPVAAHGQGDRLDPGLLPLAPFLHGHCQTLVHQEALVHPHQHLRPILGVDSAGAGVHGEDGVLLVVLLEEQGLELQAVQFPRHPAELGPGLLPMLLVTGLGGEVGEGLGVVDGLLQGVDGLEQALVAGQALGGLPGVVGVVPEVGGRHLGPQVVEVGGLVVEVEEDPRRRQALAQGIGGGV